MDNPKPTIADANPSEDKPQLDDLSVEESQAEAVKGGTQTRQTSVVVEI